MKLKTAILSLALLAGLATFTQVTKAATAYYVNRTDVYVRSHAQGYIMGRLYRGERMDIEYIDSNGWAYGYAYGYVNRCVWAQYREYSNPPNFRTHGTTVGNRCPGYKVPVNFTNGTIWRNSNGDDGMEYRLPRATEIWDNWSWGARWGNSNHRGTAPAGSLWRIRYTTNDGGGVMAHPCRGHNDCSQDWVFILRSSIN